MPSIPRGSRIRTAFETLRAAASDLDDPERSAVRAHLDAAETWVVAHGDRKARDASAEAAHRAESEAAARRARAGEQEVES